MLDLNTFGSSPAAIYLTQLLNERGDNSLVRKVTNVLSSQRKLLNCIASAHLVEGVIPTSVFASLITLISDSNRERVKSLEKYDAHISALCLNVLEGSVKTWKRRITEASRQQQHVARATPQGMRVADALALPLDNEKTHALLKERSKRYLARKGKRDTLY